MQLLVRVFKTNACSLGSSELLAAKPLQAIIGLANDFNWDKRETSDHAHFGLGLTFSLAKICPSGQ